MRNHAVRADVIPDALWPHVSAIIAVPHRAAFSGRPTQRSPARPCGCGNRARIRQTRAVALTGFSRPSPPSRNWMRSPATSRSARPISSASRRSFDALATQILPALIQKKRGSEQRLRLWSAACSTGEEAVFPRNSRSAGAAGLARLADIRSRHRHQRPVSQEGHARRVWRMVLPRYAAGLQATLL